MGRRGGTGAVNSVMSEAMGSSTEVTVYVELLDEGVFVMRPAPARRLSENAYRILPTSDYDPDVETWRFPPGSEVECARERRSGGNLLVAKRRVSVRQEAPA